MPSNIHNRADLVAQTAVRAGVTEAVAHDVIVALTELTTETVTNGGSVRITGLATILRRKSAPRLARNPYSGEEVRVPARFVPALRWSNVFRDKVIAARAVRPSVSQDRTTSGVKKTTAKKATPAKATKKATAKKAPAAKKPTAVKAAPTKASKSSAAKTTAKKATAAKKTTTAKENTAAKRSPARKQAKKQLPRP